MGFLCGLNWRAWFSVVAFALSVARPTTAAPLDLQDPTPRRIEVRFEVSPRSAPGQLDSFWSPNRAAFLESTPDESTIRLRIPAEEIEAHLRMTGAETIPGSFSEFIWTLDPETGHVLHAAFSGRVREHFSFGLFRTSALVEIRVEMTTKAAGAFRARRGLLGLQTNSFCAPSRSRPDCVAVPATRFDPESGYVNAVGSVDASMSLVRVRTFSPLGEARFSERTRSSSETTLPSTSGEPGMVCSPHDDGPCSANLGGES